MAESSDSESMLKGTERKKRRKNKEKWNATRLLYNETPSDEYVEENECVLPCAKKVKPPPFSKVWSDEDEISILRGMIKFKDETGRDAGPNMVEFRSFILESLICQATLVQLREKVRRLRGKYEKSLERGNAPTTPHEVQLFQLCQKIWSELPNSSEQQNIVVKKNHNITEKGKPEKQNPPENGRLRQQIIEQHKIIPPTGLDGQTLEALFQRVSKDMELVVNSKPCLRGNKKEVGIRVLDLCLQNNKVRLKFATLVQEKVNSPELRDSPELLEQEILRAYLEAKMEHAQLLLNAYDSFIKSLGCF
ncbi:unnamed protein product [Withania somnifera]